MFKHILVLLLYGCLFCTAQAQTFNITGTIRTAEKTALSGATAVLLSAQDSTLQHFMITGDNGAFQFKNVQAESYILQVSFLGYENYNETFLLDADRQFEVELQEESKLLEEVNVTAERIPIQLKGDTIEYAADAFATRPNAVVEDLLKKLPGVEVDRNGQIKAQGKEVAKVLVDGKEFFGNDATIATQNLPADAIEKVQVFDKKSDTAEFTGVDDGERNKTINLTLKEDKKHGYFGNVSGGYGTDDRYKFKGNINRFSPNLQFSVIGRSNNTNEQGFSFQDYLDFMGGMGALMSGRVSINPEEMGVSFNDGQRSLGFVNTSLGGLNMNYDFSKNTQLHLNYFYNQLRREEERNVFRQNLLGEQAAFETRQQSDKVSQNHNHRMNAELKHKIDSTQDLKLRTDVTWNDNTRTSNSFSETFDAMQKLENSSLSNYLSKGQRLNLSSTLTYRKRFSKLGRAFVGTAALGHLDRNTRNDLDAMNRYADFSEDILQEQLSANQQFNYRTRLSYTEPLGKKKYLQLSYRRQDFSDDLVKKFFDLEGSQRIRNTRLSNQFTKDYVYDVAGLTFQWNKKKSKLSLGLDAQNAQLRGSLGNETTDIARRFQNLLPNARWQYDFSTMTNFSASYRSSIEAPTLEQLQPIVDNSDPLNVYIGNPDLGAEYRHNLNTTFSLFDQFSFTNLFAGIYLTYTENKITESRSVDDLLRQTTRPINVDNDVFANANLDFGTAIRPIKCKINLQYEAQYNRALLLVNDLENTVNRWGNNVSLSLENRKKTVIDALVGAKLSLNNTTYSINTAQNQSFLNQTYFTDFNWQISENWNINSSIDYTIYAADRFNPQDAVALWQASVSRYIGEAQRWEITLSAFDLLNQNVGINRNSSANFIQTEQIRSLGRYFMLSCAYSIKGFGKEE